MTFLRAERLQSAKGDSGFTPRGPYPGIFQQARVSAGRCNGICQLVIVWKSGARKTELVFHSFLLCFNHEGVKEQRIKRVNLSGEKDFSDYLFPEYTEITLHEAIALIQDAYCQNIKYNTPPAEGFTQYGFLLEYETAMVDRFGLLCKLAAKKCTPRMLAGICLAAFRRLDNALLYDFSSKERKRKLGDRDRFLQEYGTEYAFCTFLKSRVISINRKDSRYMVSAYAVVSTEEEEVSKISIQLVLKKSDGSYYLDDFRVVGQSRVDADDPDHPMNYYVFCSVYEQKNKMTSVRSRMTSIKSWLEGQQDIFLTGEMNSLTCYKWLKRQGEPWRDFNIADQIICEFFLTDEYVIAYAKKPHNLAKVENLLGRYCRGYFSSHGKYHLPVRNLYQEVLANEGSCGRTLFNLRKYKAEEAFVCLGEMVKAEEALISLGEAVKPLKRPYVYKTSDRPGESLLYCYYSYKRKKSRTQATGLAELYIDGNWACVRVFGEGSLDKEIERLNALFTVKRIIPGYELEDYYDLFHPPVSEHRKWLLYHSLKQLNKESGGLGRIGLVPHFREIAQKMGAVRKGKA